MRSPLLPLAAALLLLSACGKKKDGPTYYQTGVRDTRTTQTVLLATATSDSVVRAN